MAPLRTQISKAAQQLPILLLLLVTCSHTSQAFFGEWGPDLEGPWCATRPAGQQCCTGRDDYCGVPILGTECYCDIFCNDTAYDCCPDYWPHCHGFSMPTTTPRPTTLPTPRPTRAIGPCVDDYGRQYPVGQGYSENCNTCICELTEVPYRRSAWNCSSHVCLIRPELIEMINDGEYTWSATNYSALWGMTLDQGLRYRLGTFPMEREVVRMNPITVEDETLPEYFDARQEWPGLLDPIRDQGNCGSSWAHSTTAMASDRLSIETMGTIKEKMSAQHLLSCGTNGQQGCEGGHLDRAWWYLRKQGVVTEECYPYTSGRTDEAGQCLISSSQDEGICPSGIEYNKNKRYQATPPYRIRPDEREIMQEIKDNGPVQALIEVKEDFFMYRRGVYSYARLPYLRGESGGYKKSGYHSVRIMGWGAERTPRGNIVKYWICANSWGTEWGEGGYFRILRGVNESRVESQVIGVWGKVVGDPILRDLLDQNRQRRIRGRASRVRSFRGQLRSLPTGRRRVRLLRQRRLMRKEQRGNGSKKGRLGRLSKEERQKRRQARRKERQEMRRLARRERRLRRQMKKLMKAEKMSF